MTLSQQQPASLIKRLAAMLYDSLLIMALLIFATYALLPFTHGQAIHAGNHWYQAYLLFIIFCFYGGFWYWRGQTLGMLAWRIQVVSMDDTQLKLWQVVVRFVTGLITSAFFGLGLLWLFTNKNRRTLFDYLAKTRCVTKSSYI